MIDSNNKIIKQDRRSKAANACRLRISIASDLDHLHQRQFGGCKVDGYISEEEFDVTPAALTKNRWSTVGLLAYHGDIRDTPKSMKHCSCTSDPFSAKRWTDIRKLKVPTSKQSFLGCQDTCACGAMCARAGRYFMRISGFLQQNLRAKIWKIKKIKWDKWYCNI